MKIIKLILKGYRRFDLIGSDTLVYTPASPYQLILGKNGIGKSSLLNELSPLPPETSDLKEGGFKEIVLQHLGHQYVLKYQLHKKLDCYFLKNGKELNDGNTIRVQRDLIWKHFQYDDKIHQIMTDFVLLTNMSGSTRREWFTRMSNADMGFAMSLYNRLKTAERDIRGAIKLNNQRIVSESAKLPEASEVERVAKEVEVLKNTLNELLVRRDNDLENRELFIREDLENIRRISHALLADSWEKDASRHTPQDLNFMIRQLQDRYQQIDHQVKEYTDKVFELRDILDKHKVVETKPLPVIEKQLKETGILLEENRRLLEDLGFTIEGNIERQYHDFENLFEPLKLIFIQLPASTKEDDDYLYSKKRLELYRTKQETLTERKMILGNQLLNSNTILDGLRKIEPITCPDCQHQFKPGVSLKDIREEELKNNQLKHELKKVHEELSINTERLNEQQNYFTELKKIRRLQDDYPHFQSLFTLILKSDYLQNSPIKLIQLMKDYQRGCEISLEIKRLTKTYEELSTLRLKRLAAESMDISFVKKTLSGYEEKIEKLMNEKESVIKQGKHVKETLNQLNLLLDRKNELETLVKRLNDNVLHQVRYRNDEKLKSIISDYQSTLANREQFIREAEQTEKTVNDLLKMNESLKEEQALLKILITTLSPQDGLIAESLLGFLNQFLTEMRNVIDQIWSYPMVPYLELTEDGVDLDYRFKVDVDDEITVKDVAYLSRGQKEIVNFVFKLLLMQHLGLKDYPLFMDEIGGSFDNVHRDRLYQYIKRLVESEQVKQVFIISHIASSHDALTTADRCVLDTDGILQAGINEVLKFNLEE